MNATLTSLAAAALAATAVAVPAALAADATAPPELEDAYLYVDRSPRGPDVARAVFKTTAPLPRRADGAIRAGVRIERVAGSIATVKRGSTCYTGSSPIRNGRIRSVKADGSVRQRPARIGYSYRVTLFRRDGGSVTRYMTLRREHTGYDAGRPLGC
jgi:hypothetical protein